MRGGGGERGGKGACYRVLDWVQNPKSFRDLFCIEKVCFQICIFEPYTLILQYTPSHQNKKYIKLNFTVFQLIYNKIKLIL